MCVFVWVHAVYLLVFNFLILIKSIPSISLMPIIFQWMPCAHSALPAKCKMNAVTLMSDGIQNQTAQTFIPLPVWYTPHGQPSVLFCKCAYICQPNTQTHKHTATHTVNYNAGKQSGNSTKGRPLFIFNMK